MKVESFIKQDLFTKMAKNERFAGREMFEKKCLN